MVALAAVLVVAGGSRAEVVGPAPTVRFAFTGDLAMVAGPAESYFRSISLDLAGDVVLGNLEGTLTDRGSSKCKPGSTTCYSFRAPPSPRTATGCCLPMLTWSRISQAAAIGSASKKTSR